MQYIKSIPALVIVAAVFLTVAAAEEPESNSTVTSTTKRLFTYSGPLLPSEWTIVSTINERAIIAFKNGTARNAPLEELDLKDRQFIEKLQNGTVYSTPYASAKEKIAQWSSTVTQTVSKLGKSVKEQFDSLINKSKDTPVVLNATAIGQ